MFSGIQQPVKKILVLRPDRLGDVILTLPTVRNLYAAYPAVQIFYLCTEYTAEILRSYTLITDVIIYDHQNTHRNLTGIRRLSIELSQYNFDLAVHLLPRFPLAFATYLAGIKYSIGTGFRWFSFLYTNRLYEHRKDNQYHEAEYNLNLLKIIGLSSTCESDVYSFFDFPVKNVARIDTLIASKFSDNPFIFIHPGSGGSSIDWPLESYIELIRLLNAWGKYRIGITGISAEREFLKPLYTSKTEFVDLVGAVGIIDLALILEKSSLFISNSTGPLHLAVAMNTPVLGFFPNSPGLGPGRWGPYSRSDQEFLTPPILPDVALSDKKNNLMDRITPQAAFERIKMILNT